MPSAADMVSKEEVNYRVAEVQDAACAQCEHFIEPDRCRVVQGKVSPDHVSDAFSPLQPDGAALESFLFGAGGGNV